MPLYVIEDPQGETMATGERQLEWLHDQGHIYEVSRTDDAVFFRSWQGTVQQLDALLKRNPDMRECDFCRESPCWNFINVRSFPLEFGPMKSERWERPVFACDECATLVRQNMKPDLIERSIVQNIAYYKRTQPGPFPSDYELRRAVRQQLREFVNKVFANREGAPYRTPDSE